MNLYWKHSPEEVHWFVELMARHPEVEFFQPSPGQALGMFKRDYRMEYF